MKFPSLSKVGARTILVLCLLMVDAEKSLIRLKLEILYVSRTLSI